MVTQLIIEAQEVFFFVIVIAVFFSHSLNIPSYNCKAMSHHHTWDNPDLQNIIPDDQKRKQNATDCAQGLDPYFRTVEATAKARQAQG